MVGGTGSCSTTAANTSPPWPRAAWRCPSRRHSSCWLFYVQTTLSLDSPLYPTPFLVISGSSSYSSLTPLLGSQGMGQVRHEPQEICTLYAFVEDLVAHAAFICYACYKSSVLDLHGHFSDWLFSSLPSCIACSLLVKVKPGLIQENDLAFSKPFCSVVR